LPKKNTLTYYQNLQITAVKSVITQGSGEQDKALSDTWMAIGFTIYNPTPPYPNPEVPLLCDYSDKIPKKLKWKKYFIIKIFLA
jgi:hypothetical protein